ncbi:MAG: MATE family efflux transporter [Eubacterium sp.]|nr:MATE family efflux transporter [Eubacterium sp.]
MTRTNDITIDNRVLARQLVKIAVPIAIQGVVSATLNLIDNLMVGALGEVELAAVGVGSQIFMIHYLFLFGMNSGSATFLAQFYGTRDMANIRKVIGFAITVSSLIAVVFFSVGFFATDPFLHIYSNDEQVIALAKDYLRIGLPCFFFLGVSVPLTTAFKATQQTKVPMIISFVVFGTNTILNYILIFGKFGAPAMGVSGAALATTIARGMEILIVLTAACQKNGFINLRERKGLFRQFFGWKKEFIARILKNSVPTTCNEVFWSIGVSMYVAAFSRIGVTAYASYQAAASINNIFSFAAFSVGDAALILIGEKLGERKRDEAIILARKLLIVGVVVGVVFGLLVIASAYPLVSLFALTKLGKVYAFRILLVYGSLMWLNLFNGINITGVLRGGGDTRFAAAAELSCIWCVAVPMAFLSALVWHLPVYLCVLALRSSDLVEATILYLRVRSKKWARTVITGL